MSQCIRCQAVITGEAYYEHTEEKWVWCSMACLMLDDEMTDCETCGKPVVREDSMQSGLYALQGSDPLCSEPVHFCSAVCMERAER